MPIRNRNAQGANTPVSLPDRVSHRAHAVGRRRPRGRGVGGLRTGHIRRSARSRRDGHRDAGDKKIVTITDEQGIYKLADLADGTWTIRVEMLGFSPLTQEVTIAAGAPPPTLELTLLPFEEITRGLPPPAVPAASAGDPGRRPRTDRRPHRGAPAQQDAAASGRAAASSAPA